MRKIHKVISKIKNANRYQKMMMVLILLYTLLSFFRLGNSESPQTFVNMKKDEYVIYELEAGKRLSEIVFFNGYDSVYLTVYFSNELSEDNASFHYDSSIATEYSDVFTWKRVHVNHGGGMEPYVMLSSYWDTTMIGELAFLDDTGHWIHADLVDHYLSESDGGALTDEQECVQTKKTSQNSTYFDEVYFPRAAYEIYENKYIFEYTHPPLGKTIQWWGISLFGISPFAFRVMGNLAGIFMLVVIYYIGKALFQKEQYGLLAATIMALDGMHFAQTRIATVDSFLALFCLLSVLFFIYYLKTTASNKKRYCYFALSGLFWGAAISVKWNGAFTGLGLGILFMLDYFINQKVIINRKWNWQPIVMGVVCFILLPITVYVISYIPVFQNENTVVSYYTINENGEKEYETVTPHSIKGFLLYQYGMYQYHSDINKGENYVPHPYASQWYTWPVMYKPMWFSVTTFDNHMKSTIATMGNPAIWWLSIVSAIFTLGYAIVKKDKVGYGISIMILATWIPYAFASREMYIYHYFVTSNYMFLTLVYAAEKWITWKEKGKYVVSAVCMLFFLTFIIFYPVYSGMVVSEKYIEATKWLSSWVY